jgi:hypothetical protein
VQENIGIAVANRPLIVRDIQSAQAQRSASLQAMGIVANSNSQTGRSISPFNSTKFRG